MNCFLQQVYYFHKKNELKKILIIRFSSIGDIVLTSPVIRAIKKQLPQTEVHFITKQKFATTLSANPYVDKLWTFEKEITEILPQLRQADFDFVVDLHHNLRSLRLKKTLGKPAASFPKLNLEKWLMVNFKINRLPQLHIVDRYFEAVKKLNVKNDQQGLDFFIAGENHVDLDLFPGDFRNGYIAFAIGAQLSTKKMPTEKIIAICEQIHHPVILLGGKEDEETGNKIAAMHPERIYNACGKFNLQQSASLAEQSRLVICHDTGLMHIAAAFRKKTISVWGNTIPQFGMFPYQPGTEQNCVIMEIQHLSCRPCSKIGYDECPKKHFRCMTSIPDEQIIRQVEKFWD